MKVNSSRLILLGVWLSGFGSAVAADSHRVLVLDVLTDQAGPNSQMLLVEVESGKILAQAEAGAGLEVGFSDKRDVVALLTSDLVAGISQPPGRLTTYRTSDLRRLERGSLPYDGRGGFMRYPTMRTLAFSPDGRVIVLRRMRSFQSNDKPLRWPVHNTIFSFVKRELDEQGKFKLARPDIEIPRCSLPSYLRVSNWPRIDIWNSSMGVVEVFDAGTGTILSRLPLDYEEDPVLKVLDPTYLEKPDIGPVNRHLGANGMVIAGGGRYAYYVPRPTRNPKAEPGFLKKIDLGADPPKAIQQGVERQPGLWAPGAAASEAGGAIVVPVETRISQYSSKPSARLKIYSTQSLRFVNDIKLSLTSCDYLEPSVDGKYMYALCRDQAKVAVIELATGREVKVLDNVGKYPVLLLALPDSEANK